MVMQVRLGQNFGLLDEQRSRRGGPRAVLGRAPRLDSGSASVPDLGQPTKRDHQDPLKILANSKSKMHIT
jgi:hypothetical protein